MKKIIYLTLVLTSFNVFALKKNAMVELALYRLDAEGISIDKLIAEIKNDDKGNLSMSNAKTYLEKVVLSEYSCSVTKVSNPFKFHPGIFIKSSTPDSFLSTTN